ncbi:hypothetical protein SERLA73DRAFT_151815 [Serpula lacrymans var. lacrymans S7.3]|uniref:Uncharacterized protein n=1 Tax=Serpula lacrymans var. lacrymans (strain S7.3) TaxID=936435 RepID=F8PST2_SERL3|nr:hypothetical protein SERLA73DRAFT_151815 [Serpula lacrymans var. lacrymans S7.3]
MEKHQCPGFESALKVFLNNSLGNNVDLENDQVDSVKARPSGKNNLLSQFDTVVVMNSPDCEATGIKGTRIGRLRVIFKLPKTLYSFDSSPNNWPKYHLAYVEWYSNLESTAEKDHLMYSVNKFLLNAISAIGAIIGFICTYVQTPLLYSKRLFPDVTIGNLSGQHSQGRDEDRSNKVVASQRSIQDSLSYAREVSKMYDLPPDTLNDFVHLASPMQIYCPYRRPYLSQTEQPFKITYHLPNILKLSDQMNVPDGALDNPEIKGHLISLIKKALTLMRSKIKDKLLLSVVEKMQISELYTLIASRGFDISLDYWKRACFLRKMLLVFRACSIENFWEVSSHLLRANRDRTRVQYE